MKVAFLKPPIGGILGLEMLTFVEPLGPICIAGGLEQEGHECAVFDLRLDGREQGLDRCLEFAPDVIGLQCNFTTERYRTLELAEDVRRLLPKAFVLVGGHDASRDPQWFMRDGDGRGGRSETARRSCPPSIDAHDRGADPTRRRARTAHQPGERSPVATGTAPTRKEIWTTSPSRPAT